MDTSRMDHTSAPKKLRPLTLTLYIGLRAASSLSSHSRESDSFCVSRNLNRPVQTAFMQARHGVARFGPGEIERSLLRQRSVDIQS